MGVPQKAHNGRSKWVMQKSLFDLPVTSRHIPHIAISPDQIDLRVSVFDALQGEYSFTFLKIWLLWTRLFHKAKMIPRKEKSLR